MSKKRGQSVEGKNAFRDRLMAHAYAPAAALPAVDDSNETDVQTFRSSGGKEWTKETAPPLPMNMRDDPLSVYLNAVEMWALMATGWCSIVRASYGLD